MKEVVVGRVIDAKLFFLKPSSLGILLVGRIFTLLPFFRYNIGEGIMLKLEKFTEKLGRNLFFVVIFALGNLISKIFHLVPNRCAIFGFKTKSGS